MNLTPDPFFLGARARVTSRRAPAPPPFVNNWRLTCCVAEPCVQRAPQFPPAPCTLQRAELQRKRDAASAAAAIAEARSAAHAAAARECRAAREEADSVVVAQRNAHAVTRSSALRKVERAGAALARAAPKLESERKLALGVAEHEAQQRATAATEAASRLAREQFALGQEAAQRQERSARAQMQAMLDEERAAREQADARLERVAAELREKQRLAALTESRATATRRAADELQDAATWQSLDGASVAYGGAEEAARDTQLRRAETRARAEARQARATAAEYAKLGAEREAASSEARATAERERRMRQAAQQQEQQALAAMRLAEFAATDADRRRGEQKRQASGWQEAVAASERQNLQDQQAHSRAQERAQAEAAEARARHERERAGRVAAEERAREEARSRLQAEAAARESCSSLREAESKLFNAAQAEMEARGQLQTLLRDRQAAHRSLGDSALLSAEQEAAKARAIADQQDAVFAQERSMRQVVEGRLRSGAQERAAAQQQILEKRWQLARAEQLLLAQKASAGPSDPPPALGFPSYLLGRSGRSRTGWWPRPFCVQMCTRRAFNSALLCPLSLLQAIARPAARTTRAGRVGRRSPCLSRSSSCTSKRLSSKG